MEEWRDVKDFPGYQVSNTGKIKSFINNRHGICKKSHILKPVLNPKGYETVTLGRKNRRLVHRLVATEFIPNPDDLPLVRHIDDNPRNNNVSNLRWGTQVDNMQDCVRHGRLVGDTRAAIQSRKKPVVATTLNDEFVGEYESLNAAARELGVWQQHISSVLAGRISQTGGYRFKWSDKGVDDFD